MEKISTSNCYGRIDVGCACKACGSNVVTIPDNTGLFNADYVTYCANKGCVNHAGTPWYGGGGDDETENWVIKKDTK